MNIKDVIDGIIAIFAVVAFSYIIYFFFIIYMRIIRTTKEFPKPKPEIKVLTQFEKDFNARLKREEVLKARSHRIIKKYIIYKKLHPSKRGRK